MSTRDNSAVKFDKLRKEVKKLIQERPEFSAAAPDGIMELIHELKIHQAELHIQNEELQRAQEDLADLQREFHNLYEFAPCGYLTLDEKGLVTRANLTAVEILKTSRQYLVGSGFIQYITANTVQKYSTALDSFLKTREKQSFNIELQTTGTSALWVRVELEADFFPGENGQVVEWRLVLMDISDYISLLKKKQKIEVQLIQAQKLESIGNLAGGIAHDFNNILASIVGFAELALDDLVKGSTHEEYLKEIYQAGVRAKELVTQILTFARKTNEAIKPVSIKDIIIESLGFLRSSIPTDIAIKHDIRGDSLVVGNPALLQQVVINLVSNAADSMENSGGSIDIICEDITIDENTAADKELLGAGLHAQLTISDNGAGIAPEILDQIFEPYFTTKGMGKGTGMGLATAHGTVKKYGGAITVESRQGKGTVFKVLLPSSKSAQETDHYQPETVPRGSEHILVVDDEAAIVKLTTLMLERLGYKVSSRTDSVEALELFKAAPDDYDLVLSDMTMPNLSGDRLTIELLNTRPDIPVILCTGYSKKMSEEAAADIGIKAFAFKPIVKADLARTVRRVLDESNTARM